LTLGAFCKVFVVPESPLRAFWRLRGELVVFGALPLARNVRLRLQLPFIMVEMAAMAYTFALVFPWQQVLLRFAAASGLSAVVAWLMDWTARRSFVQAWPTSRCSLSSSTITTS
jgi:hypothetical protein